eukprot:scaffold210746_cov17-Tisochrysis_lutea.AAC.1
MQPPGLCARAPLPVRAAQLPLCVLRKETKPKAAAAQAGISAKQLRGASAGGGKCPKIQTVSSWLCSLVNFQSRMLKVNQQQLLLACQFSVSEVRVERPSDASRCGRKDHGCVCVPNAFVSAFNLKRSSALSIKWSLFGGGSSRGGCACWGVCITAAQGLERTPRTKAMLRTLGLS